jgi:chemotaxis protein MotB
VSASRRHARKGHAHEEEHENEERWLVSFADMMTLLMCLFMVLFSISSVNTSKFESLQRALQDAFSGRVLSGGKAMMQTGNDAKPNDPSTEPPLPAIEPLAALSHEESTKRLSRDQQTQQAKAAAASEQEEFQGLKRRIDALVARHGLQGRVRTEVRQRGLVVQLLTDKVFFDSGDARIKAGALRLLDAIAVVIRDERRHPVTVEGHTDSQPIASAQYPTNWELSGARAAAVVRDFQRVGVLERRMSLAGFGAEQPAATNSTAAGRARNRRVVVVLNRLHTDSTP